MHARAAFVSRGASVYCVVYYARLDEAIVLGSMRRSLVESVPGLNRQWRELMIEAMRLATGEPALLVEELTEAAIAVAADAGRQPSGRGV
jgi:hypothetical protein